MKCFLFFSLQTGKAVYFAWARHDQDIITPTDFMKHGDKASLGRGHTTVGYDMYTGKEMKDQGDKSSASSLVSSVILVAITALLQLIA